VVSSSFLVRAGVVDVLYKPNANTCNNFSISEIIENYTEKVIVAIGVDNLEYVVTY